MKTNAPVTSAELEGFVVMREIFATNFGRDKRAMTNEQQRRRAAQTRVAQSNHDMKQDRSVIMLGIVMPILMLIFGAPVNATAQQQRGSLDPTAHMQKGHAAALGQWLKTRTGLRPATVADCRNKYGLESMRQSFGESFHPYYLSKDFNNDGVVDFTAALIDPRRKADSQFTLVVFHGAGNFVANGKEPEDGGAFKAAFTQEGLDLRQGGLWAGELIARRTPLYVGVFETDDCTYLRWNGKRYVLRPCEGN